jgi:excinuclease ABC subunit C
MGKAGEDRRAEHFDVSRESRKLPPLPGVYSFLDETGKILYIGKARDLRRRVAAYSRPHSWLIPAMLERARSLDYTVTKTEREALILEAGMVRHHKPRFNVRLKDDKRFPYLKLTRERFPRLLYVRRTSNDGARYFGPFTYGPINRTLRFVRKLFGLRPCARMLPRGCIYGDTGTCLAPCTGGCTEGEYLEAARQAERYLGGEHRQLLSELERRMDELSGLQQFEKAAAIRDQIRAITRLAAQQRVDFLDPEDRDAIVVRRLGPERALLLHYAIRGGVVVARKNFSLDVNGAHGPAEVLEGFMTQYYGNASPPPQILLPLAVTGKAVLEDWLSSVRGKKVQLRVPKKGPGRRLLDLMETDLGTLATALSGEKAADAAYKEAASELGRSLGLERPPTSIEAFDISTIQGTNSVGAKVRFRDGRPEKSGYRRFKIRTVRGQDDFAMMGEVVQRRLGHKDDDPLGDLILIDGGKGQLAAAQAALERAGVRVPLAALAKREEDIFVPGKEAPVPIPKGSAAKLLLMRVRDEAHRFAVGYHRNLRANGQIGSALDNIPGLGQTKASALLRRFSSVAGIRAASEDELRQVEGIGPALARKIKESLV